MVLFFRALTRLFILAIAYILAVSAAMATLVAAIWGWQVNYIDFASQTPEEEIFNLFAYSAIGLFVYATIMAKALVPAAVFGLITEGLSWRSIFVHVLGSGAIAIYIILIAQEPNVPPAQQDLIITLAAGFVAGFVYWLFAGRSAGNWRVVKK